MTATNAAKTRSLDPGQSVTLSETASGKVWAERSAKPCHRFDEDHAWLDAYLRGVSDPVIEDTGVCKCGFGLLQHDILAMTEPQRAIALEYWEQGY